VLVALWSASALVPAVHGFTVGAYLPMQARKTSWGHGAGLTRTHRQGMLARRRAAASTPQMVAEVPLGLLIADGGAVGFVGKSVIIGGALAGGLHAVSGAGRGSHDNTGLRGS